MTICAETAGRSWQTCTRGIQGCICGMDNKWRVAHVLEQHNKYRRGDIDMDQSPSPQAVGLAIDAAVKMLLEQAKAESDAATNGHPAAEPATEKEE